MAEKGFGVKEVNLIGASGTPTITSPNNINLNAANVAISTNVSVGGTMTVTGGAAFGIGSTVGIGSTLYVSHGDLYLRDNHQLNINNDALTMRGNNGGNSFITSLIDTSGGAPGNLYISNITGDVEIDASEHFSVKTNSTEQAILATQNGSVALYHDGGNKKLETNSSGVTVTGTLSATTFSGSGASLTTLPAANLTGTLPAISGANLTNVPAATPTNSDIQVVYTVTANGSSAYRFGGNGIVSTEDNPDVYLIRGLKYRFINNSGGSHPFQIRQSSGGSAYSSGVTNNGASSGNIDFQVPYSAPSHLYYQCTVHGGMVGNLYIRGAGGNNTNVGVTTFIGHVQANNIKLDRGSASDTAFIIDTTSTSNACRIKFNESGTNKGQIAYSHDNDQIEVIGMSGNSAAIITNGNITGFKQNASGIITKPKQPCFAAKGVTSHTAGSSTHIDYTTQLFDNGTGTDGDYDPTAGQSKFTAPVSGYYFFHATCMFDSNLTGYNYCFLDFKISGTVQGRERMMPRPSGGQHASVENSAIFYLTANQYVQVVVTQNGGNPMNVRNDYRFFEGYLIG